MSHPQINSLFSTLQKIWRPLSIISGSLTILIALYFLQQTNIYSLNNEIEAYKVKVNNAGYVDDKLRLQKDILAIEKDATAIQNGAYVSLVQLLGGIVLGITAWVGYQNFRIGEKNLRVTEDKQVNERFSKSIEHLGNEKIDIRLGGIYALEQIAVDSPKYHWTIVEILSAYIRKESWFDRSVFYDDEDDYEFDTMKVTDDEPSEKITADVLAALTVIARRKIDQDPQEKMVDLRRVELPLLKIPKANLTNADLSGANLISADLNGANLSGANLSEVMMSNTDLRAADLSSSKDLNCDQIGSAITDVNTRLPEDLKPDNTSSIELPSNVEE